MQTENYAHLRNQILRLSDLKPRYVSDVPINKIRIDNYRKTKPDSYLMELGKSIEMNGLLQAPGLIEKDDGTYDLIFGQCRVLAIQQYTSIGDMLPEAKIWPAAAERFKKTIAYIENREREDPPLDEEVAGIKDAIETEFAEYPNPRKAFTEQTGYSDSEISRKVKIAEAMDINKKFAEIVKKQIIGDYITLYDMAQAVTTDAAESKKKYVDQLIDLLLSGKLAGSVRDATSQVKKHVKNGGVKPKLASVDQTIESAPALPQTQPEIPKKRTITYKQIQVMSEKFEEISEIEPETVEAINSLIKKLQSVLNAATVSKANSG